MHDASPLRPAWPGLKGHHHRGHNSRHNSPLVPLTGSSVPGKPFSSLPWPSPYDSYTLTPRVWALACGLSVPTATTMAGPVHEHYPLTSQCQTKFRPVCVACLCTMPSHGKERRCAQSGYAQDPTFCLLTL
eukprot:1160788-Pelagomonas_calceolata.AAC.8